MPSTDFDYDAAIASEPIHWKERGLHWHAYVWRGNGPDFGNDRLKDDMSSDIPPRSLADWLNKPQRGLKAVHADPVAAADWLQSELDTLPPALHKDVMDHEFRARMRLYDLRCGNPVVVTTWLRGPMMSALYLIPTASNCH